MPEVVDQQQLAERLMHVLNERGYLVMCEAFSPDDPRPHPPPANIGKLFPIVTLNKISTGQPFYVMAHTDLSDFQEQRMLLVGSTEPPFDTTGYTFYYYRVGTD